MTALNKDCQAESNQGQQSYNVCMGEAKIQADKDLTMFYTSLQMLCHDVGELTSLQSAHKAWLCHRDKSLNAAHAAWPEGTGAPGFSAQIYLPVLRDICASCMRFTD